MRTIALATLLSLPLQASAGPISDKVGAVGSVQLEGTVSTTLYTSSHSRMTPFVRATVPGGEDGEDQEFFFALASSSTVIVVSDAFVTAAGLKVRSGNKKLINLMGEDHAHKLGGELKTVEIPSLKIGDLELNNISALVSSSKHGLGGVHADLQIGLGAIPDLAWAILPSKGEVQFTSAQENGATLVSSVGTAIPTTTTDWDDPKFGKDKTLASAASLLSPVTIGGATVTASLEVAVADSSINSSEDLQSTAHRSQADRHDYWVDSSTIGENSVQGWVRASSVFERGQFPNHQAVLGSNLLRQVDIAVDPATQTMALNLIETANWTRQVDTRLEKALTDLENASSEESTDPAESKNSGKDDETEEGDVETDAPNTEPLKTLAAAYMDKGQVSEAIATWSEVADAEAQSCSNWLALGTAQMAAGDSDAAIESLNQASELYHSWWDVDLETRTAISDYRAASESKKVSDTLRVAFMLDEPSEDAPESQPGSCHVADGALASAHLANGDYEAVGALYGAHLDLDPSLAQAQATASLQSGDNQGAHAALRQAMKRESSPQVNSRVGLAMVYIAEGDWSTAERHFKKALEIDSHDSILATVWVDAMVEAQGAAHALKASTQWAKTRPQSIAAQFAQLRAATHANATQALETGTQEALARIAMSDINGFASKTELANSARVMAFLQESEKAEARAQQAIERDPSSGDAWVAMAEALASGQKDYTQALETASKVAPLTLGLSGQLIEPAPEPVEEEGEGTETAPE